MEAREFQINQEDRNQKTLQPSNSKQIYSKRVQNYNFEPETEPEYEKTFDQFLQTSRSQIKPDEISESHDRNSYVIEPFIHEKNIPKYTCKNFDNMNMSFSSQSDRSSRKNLGDNVGSSLKSQNKENFDYYQFQFQNSKQQNQPQLWNNSYNQNTTINPLSSSIWTQRDQTLNKTIDQTFATEKHFDISLVIQEVCQNTQLIEKQPTKEPQQDEMIFNAKSPKAHDSFDRILPEVMYQEQKHREEQAQQAEQDNQIEDKKVEYNLEQTLADLDNQEKQAQVNSGNHEQTETGEDQDEKSSMSSIKSQDIPYYVKTIKKFNLQIQEAVFLDKKNKIFKEMRFKNKKRVPIEHLNEYDHIFFRRRRHPWMIKQLYYRNKSCETPQRCSSV